MSARLLSETGTHTSAFTTALNDTLREGPRYLLASAFALAVDAGVYVTLIRLGGVHYLAAAPVGFVLGIAIIYMLSTRWVFRHRRLPNARSEFLVFTVLGIAGLLMNQLALYVCVEAWSISYELSKLASAAFVFCFNFISRKLFLFTRL